MKLKTTNLTGYFKLIYENNNISITTKLDYIIKHKLQNSLLTFVQVTI
jgi:hypothetical protein